MKKMDHIGCYVAGKIQQLRMLFIVTCTMPYVMRELDLITWPKNSAVRIPHEIFFRGLLKIRAVTDFEVGKKMNKIAGVG